MSSSLQAAVLLIPDLGLRQKASSLKYPDGCTVITARTLCQAKERLARVVAASRIASDTNGQHAVVAVVVDLRGVKEVPRTIVDELIAVTAKVLLIGFAPHIDDDKIAEAKAQGFFAVYPRGAFFRQFINDIEAICTSFINGKAGTV